VIFLQGLDFRAGVPVAGIGGDATDAGQGGCHGCDVGDFGPDRGFADVRVVELAELAGRRIDHKLDFLAGDAVDDVRPSFMLFEDWFGFYPLRMEVVTGTASRLDFETELGKMRAAFKASGLSASMTLIRTVPEVGKVAWAASWALR